MNILRITYEWPPPWLGLVPQPYEITASQAKKGHKLTVFCGRWPMAGKLELINGVDIKAFFREPLNGTLVVTLAPLVLFYYLYWRLSNKPDVIHAHGHFGVWILVYRSLLKKFFPKAKELKIPYAAHFHNTAKGRWKTMQEKGEEPKPFTKAVTWPLEVWANKLAVENASAYICVSQQVKNELVELCGADVNKCTVVESGVNPELFKQVGPDEKDKTRKDIDLIPTDKVIINYGFMVKRKNPHLLVEALKFLPVEYKLILLGDGDTDYLEEIEEIARKNAVSDRLLKIGYTPYPSVPVALQAADIFVLPSKWEGFPKVVVEALSCGVPVLASGFKATDEIEGLFYLDDFDPQFIAKRIREIMDNPPIVNAKQIASAYSWDKKADQIDKIYETLLSKTL